MQMSLDQQVALITGPSSGTPLFIDNGMSLYPEFCGNG